MIENKWFKTEDEFLEYVRAQLAGSDDYSSCADSVANIAIAAFNYAASKQGITGFQSGWASLQFLKEVKGIKGPFGIVDGEKFLYPQYDPIGQVIEWEKEWKPWLRQMAKDKLNESSSYIHPNVKKRWEEYANSN